ncbi:MAG: copper amine oxidase N-terminal domain-containing protein [Clostridiales bacterium]|jgi:hypothetical protein|nr:copper amine oxidase N-terminal domain-containing protein [Clostridiales bacterium]
MPLPKSGTIARRFFILIIIAFLFSTWNISARISTNADIIIITGFEELEPIYVQPGDFGFALPASVIARTADNSSLRVPVIWNRNDFDGVAGTSYTLHASVSGLGDLGARMEQGVEPPEIIVSVFFAPSDYDYGGDSDNNDTYFNSSSPRPSSPTPTSSPKKSSATPSPTPAVLSNLQLEFFVDSPIFSISSGSGKVFHTMDVPVIYNDKGDRTIFPVRFISEALGFDVEYENTTRTVIISNPSKRVIFCIDSKIIVINDDISKMDTPAVEMNWRTYVPLRYLAKAFDFAVEWESFSQKVTLNRNI